MFFMMDNIIKKEMVSMDNGIIIKIIVTNLMKTSF